MKRIGIFGGSFDPVHIGHLVTAIEAVDQLGLDRLDFVPAGKPVHKAGRPMASFTDRVAMLREAVEACRDPRLSVNEYEGQEHASGYMADTLEWYARMLHDDRMFLVIGADQYEALGTWAHLDRVLRLAGLVVASRPGYKIDPKAVPAGSLAACLSIELQISSSEIRRRIREGRSVKFLVPEGVCIMASEVYKEALCPGSRPTAAASSIS